ncbi:Fic family protein [Mesoplasma chauliocola]|uniref:Fic family protein n=1 Tax=Mesoplasma chauliocola TaxID=216427 RepID=UPI003B846C4A
MNQASTSEEIAAHILLFIITQQVFFDGNKRTVFLIANKILLENFYKFILLDETNIDKFNLMLNDLYINFKYEKYNNIFNFIKDQIKNLK